VLIRRNRTRTRLLWQASIPAVRRSVALCLALACGMGFLRVSFPAPLSLLRPGAGDAVSADTFAASSDQGAPTLDEARLPRTGLRRAITLSPGHLDAEGPPGLGDGSGGALLDRAVVAPRSFVPTPPFHPPRVV
jgi:hypothetical protein